MVTNLKKERKNVLISPKFLAVYGIYGQRGPDQFSIETRSKTIKKWS